MTHPTHTAEHTGERVTRLVRAAWGFGGSAEEFLAAFLQHQAALVDARCGAILRTPPPGSEEVDALAMWPALLPGSPTPPWLEAAASAVGTGSVGIQGAVVELEGVRRRLVLVPLAPQAGAGLVGAYVLDVQGDELSRAHESLLLSASLAGIFDLRAAVTRRTSDLSRLRAAMEVLAGTNRHAKFTACAFELVNHVAAVWKCERVSLGFVRGAYVRLAAMSHTEKLVRNTDVAQAIAGAMEESVDQDIEVWAPQTAATEAEAVVRCQAEELALRDGQGWVCTLPLRIDGKVVGAISVERRSSLTLEELEPLRLACELITPRLVELEERDRWIGARAALASKRAAAWAIGAQHTWAKLLAILVLSLLLFMTFVKGTAVVSAPFVLEATSQRVVPAPFDGYLASVNVQSGDRVVTGQALAAMETADLALELAEARARENSAIRSASIARSEGKTADAQIAEAAQREANARVELLQYRIERARIVAPIDGVAVFASEDDLQGRVGGAIRLGEKLFHVAQVESVEVRLAIPDADVADVHPGMSGELAAVSRPEIKIPFVIERISPAAQQVDGRTVFYATAKFARDAASDLTWLRPGMEGVAETHIGEARYGWIWTKRMVNWLRMRLWL